MKELNRLSFRGHLVVYSQNDGEVAGRHFKSLQVGYATPEEASSNLYSSRDYKIISVKECWIEPYIQFEPNMCKELIDKFPDRVAVKTYQDWKSGEVENCSMSVTTEIA